MTLPRAVSVAVLGSTGSIGVNTLSVIAQHPQRFEVFALAANSDVETMFAQCEAFRPRYAVLANESAAARLAARVGDAGLDCEVMGGAAALLDVATRPEVDAVMAAIVGAAGLASTLGAAKAGKKIMLANKESMVMAGPLLIDTARASGSALLPIDSEHNAIFQALPANFARDMDAAGIRRLILTASGGPFLHASAEVLAGATPDQACAHPKWSMGRKISVDSATLMNKGLEVIEAHYLFGAKPEQIDVVIHPQSIVHSMVEYVDGSVIAQMGNPDMRTPIAHALAYPQRVEAGVKRLDLAGAGRLDFTTPDCERFPCLRLAYQALRAGGSAPVYLNAANEVAVDRFLNHEIAFNAIAEIVEKVMDDLPSQRVESIEQILAADGSARAAAAKLASRGSGLAERRAAGGLGH
ncbi:MAG: 1-deoxy-D-xylulose 5-phosphate reductoisomerase [Betaproteobacteria bacterium SG8_40]|jgi:1-deoxy-D-xylulose-5-phosphate reductoisomerase|nr:MAG: 1-deoxy-D-xylulose 5-phosphate reductoisomerase [Betaproteobacteria bacterium SG8_40]